MEKNEGGLERMEEVERLLGRWVKRAIDTVCREACLRTPRVKEAFHYGAIGIDPKHLVIWYIFRSTSDTATARKNGLATFLEERSREVLRTEGYPSEAIETIQVSFASDEEIHGAGGFRAFFT